MPPTTRAQTSSSQPQNNNNTSSSSQQQQRQRHKPPKSTVKHAQSYKSAIQDASLSEPNDPLELPRFTIDLSLPPEQRYAEVCATLHDEMRGLEALFDEVVGGAAPWVPISVLRWFCWAVLWGVHSKEESAELRVCVSPCENSHRRCICRLVD
jgi:hypothetical protein